MEPRQAPRADKPTKCQSIRTSGDSRYFGVNLAVDTECCGASRLRFSCRSVHPHATAHLSQGWGCWSAAPQHRRVLAPGTAPTTTNPSKLHTVPRLLGVPPPPSFLVLTQAWHENIIALFQDVAPPVQWWLIHRGWRGEHPAEFGLSDGPQAGPRIASGKRERRSKGNRNGEVKK